MKASDFDHAVRLLALIKASSNKLDTLRDADVLSVHVPGKHDLLQISAMKDDPTGDRIFEKLLDTLIEAERSQYLQMRDKLRVLGVEL